MNSGYLLACNDCLLLTSHSIVLITHYCCTPGVKSLIWLTLPVMSLVRLLVTMITSSAMSAISLMHR